MEAKRRWSSWVLVLPALWAAAACVEAQQGEIEYPEARRTETVETFHGVEVRDPYRWMEELDSPELQSWMRAQDELTLAYLADQQHLIEWIAERTRQLGSYARRSPPVSRGDRTFYTRRDEGEAFGQAVVDGPDGVRVLLDLETLNRSGDRNGIVSVSWDGRHVVTSHTSAASSLRRWPEVRVMRAGDGTYLPETLEGYYSGGSNIAWTADGGGFFYSRYPVPDDPQAPLGRPAVYHHELGTPQSSDRLVFERPESPELTWALRVTLDGRYLVVSGSASGGTFAGLFDRVFYAPVDDLRSGFRELMPGVEGQFAVEASDGDRFLVRTTLDAPRMRLVEVWLDRPEPGHWTEVIAEGEHPMQAVSEIADFLVVQYGVDARTRARVFDRDGNELYEVEPAAPALGGFADHPDDPVTYYSAALLYDPGTLHRIDLRTGESDVHFRPELAHDPGDFQTTQVFYESRDGTRVPMSLVHRKDIELDGGNPLFMYAYGAWAWSAYPWQRYLMPWVEMGGVYAVPNVRGGGEYGEAWHRDGIGRNKQNGIDDFIAAAEWLIEHDWTSPDLVVANGGSASGIMPAAAVTQRPELFGAAVINYPSLDQVRYARFGNGASWMPEFGDPEDPEDFAALYAYSPYHRLEKGVCYPPTWIQVGDKDDTTTPMHGYKFAAALQAVQSAVPGCDAPALLKIAWEAGHSMGLTPEQRRQTQAQEQAFLVKALGLGFQPPGRD